jgi:RHS repeat-associated protein
MVGNQRTEFTYDGSSRLVSLRLLTNGSELSLRRFLWDGGRICEERDAAGVVTKRFFPQGMKAESGPVTGTFFYSRDHLGSVRELTDSSGSVRARYAYDPFGRRTRTAGDMEANFGFVGMFLSAESGLYLATFRAYDPELGRWLSRDPLTDAEREEGANLYVYVGNNPVNMTDPLGLKAQCCADEWEVLQVAKNRCGFMINRAFERCDFANRHTPMIAEGVCSKEFKVAGDICTDAIEDIIEAETEYYNCMTKSGCSLKPPSCPTGDIAKGGLQRAVREYFNDWRRGGK